MTTICRRLLLVNNGSSSSSSAASSLIISKFQTRSKHTIPRAPKTVISSERPLRQFVSGKRRCAGRNSAGRITIFHRGGGAKRSQRTVDLKRNTSSVGVVERIEYDPNRTARIAVVRWDEVDRHKRVNIVGETSLPRKVLPAMDIKGQGRFAFSSLPGMPEDRKTVSSVPKRDYVVVGLPKGVMHGSKSPFSSEAVTQMANVKDVFLSAFSSSKGKGNNVPYSFVSSLGLPRMAIAGAKPDFFVPRMKNVAEENESLSSDEIKKWDKDSIVWDHKMKRKAAVTWQSLRHQEMLGLAGVAGQTESKLKMKAKEKEKRDGKFNVDRARVTYILATQQMEPGRLVMNCDSSSNELLRRR
uniref:60S ribosomal protein L2, mitochondrial n=1 Tax=Erigeron canadensis TaxID=72917 RepID=UPI001CB93507|nr:60S ribosomal protein L2, mitochondrial [Erigeron canadensis]